VTKQLQVFATVKNLLNKHYANFAILGENFFNGPNHTFDPGGVTNEQFLGIGAPRGVWVGLCVEVNALRWIVYRFFCPLRAGFFSPVLDGDSSIISIRKY
jgi:hypothetical protein